MRTVNDRIAAADERAGGWAAPEERFAFLCECGAIGGCEGRVANARLVAEVACWCRDDECVKTFRLPRLSDCRRHWRPHRNISPCWFSHAVVSQAPAATACARWAASITWSTGRRRASRPRRAW